MSESTSPDLVERVRLLNEALNRRDFDAFEGFVAPDAVFLGPSIGTVERQQRFVALLKT